jgi:hypothetical protein
MAEIYLMGRGLDSSDPAILSLLRSYATNAGQLASN